MRTGTIVLTAVFALASHSSARVFCAGYNDTADTADTVTSSDCPDACFDLYEPVCGSDGNTYSNSCFLSIAQCENPDSGLVQASEGECESARKAPSPTVATSASAEDDCASRMCTMIYDPVCGSDGNTYGNSCTLSVAQCSNPKLSQVSEGECPETSKSEGCPDACPMIFEPVCGSDGNTYSNSCELEVTSCNNPDLQLTQVSEGECSEVTSPPIMAPTSA